MNQKIHNQIVSFIWSIADDVLRDIIKRGKYRDIILPFTVLRRIDALLENTKEKVLEENKLIEEKNIPDKSYLEKITQYPFYNISPYTMAKNSLVDSKYPFVSLLSDPSKIDSNLELYLDGFSPNIQEIISKFKVRNYLDTLKDAGITYNLIEKFTSNVINLSPSDIITSKGEILPGLDNIGMGIVFEELIRLFNEENNEEAGEHFTPREIIKLMTHLIFEPIKESLIQREGGRFSIYDPACGSGGMLTEAEKYALNITNNKCLFSLFGQESEGETWAICTADMLIKGEKGANIFHGSTLSNDGFVGTKFDFMLSNPPYGKSWKNDENAIVDDRGNKSKEHIKDQRFRTGLPDISDGQLLFLVNMISKMNTSTEIGSRIASVHNGSALFTGDAGQGASEIRKMIIENDLLECIIALPTNIFYNTGIPTYIWILSNRKEERRKGKVQLINAINTYEKLKKNLGSKNCALSDDQIDEITKIYLNFEESNISKIFNNSDFGYWKIIVERPLRLKAQLSDKAIESLRFNKAIEDEMRYIYKNYGEAIYKNLKEYKKDIENWLKESESTISAVNKTKLFDITVWENHKNLIEIAKKLKKEIGDAEFTNFNKFKEKVEKAIIKLELKISSTEKNLIYNNVSWKDEDAEPVVKENKNGKVIYEIDSELRDSENVPLNEDIDEYFTREVLKYIPDAWIDKSKTQKGYSISFTRYFYKYQPPRSLEDITAELEELQKETKNLLENFLNN